MTGWRLGYGVVPADSSRRSTFSSTTACRVRQRLRSRQPWKHLLRKRRKQSASWLQEFEKRRDIFADGLNAIPGIRCLSRWERFILFPNIAATGLSSKNSPTATERSGRRRIARNGVRRIRRRLYPIVICEFVHQHRKGARKNSVICVTPS